MSEISKVLLSSKNRDSPFVCLCFLIYIFLLFFLRRFLAVGAPPGGVLGWGLPLGGRGWWRKKGFFGGKAGGPHPPGGGGVGGPPLGKNLFFLLPFLSFGPPFCISPPLGGHIGGPPRAPPLSPP